MAGRRVRGNIQRLPSGRWQARVRDPASNRWRSVGAYDTKRAADEAIGAALAEQARGTWLRPRTQRVRLAEWTEHWRPTTSHLRPTTSASYEYLLSHLILPELGARRLDRLDTTAVAAWRSSLLAAGRAPSTVRRAYVLLRGVLDAAVTEGVLGTNPARIRGAS
jgi:hypothetical protein